MFSQDNLKYDPIPLPDHVAQCDADMATAAKGFFETMARRHTVRDFDKTPVPRSIIETSIATAGRAPSGANHQPWFFAAISNADLKARIRAEAEVEERRFYAGGAGDEWIKALEPIGTNDHKPHLTDAPWLIVVFAQRYGEFSDGMRYKNYYVPESVGIACGFLIAALHHAGLSVLTHTPNPMKFLTPALDRPASEKPIMILAVGRAAQNATVPAVAKVKKPLSEIMTVWD
ncbi:nitroreductase family protein [Shimia abyssi]|uniref:Nitroreductase n=1 Tax=Shimia abyssi TaxID=1662395 RepID=A0A2P8FE50_9RHOB|nr:nitroreductase family protein [Shimia abyssi]PSL19999.1 nitroreductase [Shimia abyssi]